MDKRITRVNLLWEESKDFKKGEERNETSVETLNTRPG